MKATEQLSNNNVYICGKLETELEYSHRIYGEIFYRTRVVVTRDSGTEDFVPIIVPSLLIWDEERQLKGKWVRVEGQFRSRRRIGEDGQSHMDLFLFVKKIEIYDDEYEQITDENLICLEGYICKEPNYRQTPLGREITEFLIAVNRQYDKSDYIPCIGWGILAKWVSEFEVGTKIRIHGRIQSRQYKKRISVDSQELEDRVAYEISVKEVQKVEKV